MKFIIFFYLVPSRILFDFEKDFLHDQPSSEIMGFYLIVAYLICHECSYFLYNVCGSTCT